jgi:dienelactone hydrolase
MDQPSLDRAWTQPSSHWRSKAQVWGCCRRWTRLPLQLKTVTIAFLLCSLAAATATSQTLIPEEVEASQKNQFDEMDRYFDRQVEEANQQREKAWQRDFSSIEAYERSVEPWRQKLLEMLGGDVYPRSPLKPKEERVAEFTTHTAWRVWFTAFENVRGYGILLVPKGTGPFPALICIHGMGGTPEGVCGLTAQPDYHNRFGLQAVQRGYVVFAPVNMNSGKKRSWLDRKAIMTGQRLQALEQVKLIRLVDYLAQRPDVGPGRIGAYGISWGGRSVMNLAALDRRIAACAISGHFNDLIPKMLVPSPNYTAFIETDEDYAFFWKQAALFNEADVVSLICPRPVFIEQGRKDRVAYWEMSQRAFKPVKEAYEKLGIGERAVYSIFEGGHEVHGVEAFQFFDSWLKPQPIR